MKICPQCFDRFGDDAAQCEKDSTPLLELGDPTDAPLIGTIAANRYLLLDLLGEGGMGEVYLAYQLSMSRRVAVKVLSKTEDLSSQDTERFIREAKCVAQLRSPNTITVHDFGLLENGDPFLVMEVLSGPTLEELIWRERTISSERAIVLIEQICLSLEEAHGLGMIHRDIKPRNVIIEDEGKDTQRAKVLDFGLVMLADPIDADGRLTQPGEIHGSPAYMAPEMWGGQYGSVGPATDIYALGCVMFEMLTGSTLFNAPTVPEYMLRHVTRPIPHLADPLLDRLAPIIERCVEKDPRARFSSVRELRLALAAPREQKAGEDAPDWRLAETMRSVSRPPPRPAHRRFALAALVALATFTIFASIADLVLRAQNTSHDLPSAAPAPPPTTVTPTVAQPASRTVSRPVAKSSALRFSEVKIATGALDPDDARASLQKLEPRLKSCFKDGGEKKITLRIFVRPDGSISAVRVTPRTEATAALQRCIERVAHDARFSTFIGNFSVLSVVIAP